MRLTASPSAPAVFAASEVVSAALSGTSWRMAVATTEAYVLAAEEVIGLLLATLDSLIGWYANDARPAPDGAASALIDAMGHDLGVDRARAAALVRMVASRPEDPAVSSDWASHGLAPTLAGDVGALGAVVADAMRVVAGKPGLDAAGLTAEAILRTIRRVVDMPGGDLRGHRMTPAHPNQERYC